MNLEQTPFRSVREWYGTPAVHPASEYSYPGVKQIFYESVPYHGKTTRVFACYSLPEGASAEHPVPGVVLIHGGGGTALADWVSVWNRRGYAAISMDTCGCVPCWAPCPCCWQWPSHEFGGPRGWGRFEEAELPPEEQWPYHAVAAAILGHSFLRSLPEVDPARIGVTGISWGGVLTCMVAGLDDRFRFAIPVYGCGFLNERSSPLPFEHPHSTPERREKWFSLWDPGIYLQNAALPMLFFSGSNDFAFPPPSLQKSFDAAPSPMKRLSVRVAYPHDHTSSWKEETIFDFADAVLNRRTVPEFSPIERNGDTLSVRVTSDRRIRSAEFHFTRAEGYWEDRRWNSRNPEWKNGILSAPIPRCATAAYFNVVDIDDCCYSSRFQFLN